MKPLQQMAHLLAVNFETLIYIGMAWWSGRYLNENYPQNFSWTLVTYAFGLLLILRSWYLVFRSLIRHQKDDDRENKGTLD
ncbi:MAG: hypothetical protein NTX25_17505 [Proteobacteria bacterium]|nr:hypothetical protein [Pseudomonadota bacterium]